MGTRSPAVPAIADELDILRGLLPLRRKVRSTSQSQLDEAATANWIAETGLWAPVVGPVNERWLDVALVVDDSESMGIWQRTVTELRTLLERSGSFRDVRVWNLDGDLLHSEAVTISGPVTDSGSRREPRELVDPTGRRLVMITSDCVGRAWSTESMGATLATWASAGPTVIVQMLPQRLWQHCAPDFHPGFLRGLEIGPTNSHVLTMHTTQAVTPPPDGPPIPVVELEGRWLKTWASLVSGTAGSGVNGVAVFADSSMADNGDDSAEEPPDTTPAAQVREFRAHASLTATRLAACLAAGAPLTMTVMRLVQGAMLPDSRPSHLAEVFLFGLLRKADVDNLAGQPPDDVEYEFHPGVREELLGGLARQDALMVLATVSNFVSQRMGSPLDFRALLTTTDPSGHTPVLSPPFAKVAYQVLTSLGGRYAEAAERLTRTSALRPRNDIDSDDRSTGHDDEPRSEESHWPRIFHKVPGRNPRFTGRDELIHELHNLLVTSTSRRVLLPNTLHGLGGVGKTHLAVEYAYRFAHEYDLVCWLPAHDVTQVRASLVELGRAMGLPDNANVTRAVNEALNALRPGGRYRRWLLVFDNADQTESLKPYLPARTGHVLITSRNVGWSEEATPFEIDVFTRKESVALLRERVSAISEGDADQLAERLGDLPLALEQAGAWLAVTKMPVDEYLTLFNTQHARLVKNPPGDYPTTVGAAYALTLDRLREQNAGAAQLLDVCAFLGAEPITINLLWDGRDADLPAPLGRTLRDLGQLRGAVRAISRYALARVDETSDQFTIHRLVRDVLRSRLDEATRQTTNLAAQHILAKANPWEPDLEVNWQRHGELSPHIEPAGLIDSEEDDVRQVVLDQIRCRWARGDYESSRELGEVAVARWRTRPGPDDVITLLSCRHLAVVLRTLGEYAKARQLAEDTLARFQEKLGENNEHTLFTRDSVAWDHRISGNFLAARRLDEANLAQFSQDLGDDHPLALKAANNFAINLRWLGHFAEARRVDEKSLRLRRSVYGEENRHTQLAIASLARDLYGLGYYAEGLRRQESALEIQQRLLGPFHAEVLSETRNLITLLRKTGQHPRACQLAKYLVDTYKRRFGPSDEPTLAANVSYVNALDATGKYGEAHERGHDILERYRSAFGAEHPATLACATNLAIVLRHRRQFEEALKLNQDTLDAFRRTLGDDHPFTLCCANNTANDLAAVNQQSASLDLAEDTWRRSRLTRGEDHPDTLACALNVAITRTAVGRVDDADPLLTETIAQFKRRLGDDHPSTKAATHQQRAECDIEPPET
jgi:tetratricopeptide (TPR) repeat protein